MAPFRFKKKVIDPADSGEVERGKRTIKRCPAVALEVKLLASEGLEAGPPGSISQHPAPMGAPDEYASLLDRIRLQLKAKAATTTLPGVLSG